MNISGINKYMTFGLKEEWINILIQDRENFRAGPSFPRADRRDPCIFFQTLLHHMHRSGSFRTARASVRRGSCRRERMIRGRSRTISRRVRPDAA